MLDFAFLMAWCEVITWLERPLGPDRPSYKLMFV